MKRNLKNKKSRKNKSIKTIVAIIFLVTIVLYFYNIYKLNSKEISYSERALNIDFETKIKSGNLSTDYEIYKVLDDINSMKLNTVNIPVVINIENIESSVMEIDENSLNKAITLIEELEGRNISIILEAYPWISDGSEYETKWMPNNIDEFFYNWKYNVLGTLVEKVCNNYQIDAVNIASNLVMLEEYEDRWIDIIEFIRGKYEGLITYRTNWWYAYKGSESEEEFYKKINNKIFGSVDFISVAAYFELTDKMYAKEEDIINALESSTYYNRGQNIKEELLELHERWDKPIFFGELGFPKRLGASIEPHNAYISKIPSNKQQANCFSAYNKVFKNEDAILGFSVFAIGNDSYEKAYYPCRKSKKIIRNWYN